MRVVIIGNGIAGINVAQALRSGAEQAALSGSAAGLEKLEIEVFAGENHPFYSRVRLPEVLSGASKPEDIAFYKPEWYEKKDIAVRIGCPVASIDAASKTISLCSGESVSYDFLVIATGASANRPSIPGSDLSGVFTMRTMEDVAAIRANLAFHGESASVIGGGLLGLEAARALKDAGAGAVRVFEIFPRLLPRQLDETGADLLQKRFAEMGIEVVCGAETSAFLADSSDESRAASIKLKDGRCFPSDTTILSMGVHPNVGLASSAGLAVNRGVVVDSMLRTSDPCIYAVGDVAEFCGVVWGIIPAALEQASVAARAILASARYISPEQVPTYIQTVPKTSLKVGDIELLSIGKAVLSPEEAASDAYIVRSLVREGEGRYEKFVLLPCGDQEYTLAGAIVYGLKKHQASVQKLMGKPVSLAEIDALLAE